MHIVASVLPSSRPPLRLCAAAIHHAGGPMFTIALRRRARRPRSLDAAAAQAPLAAPSFGITPYAGYMKFGSLVAGPFGTNVRDAGAPVYGAELQLGLVPGHRPGRQRRLRPARSRDRRPAHRRGVGRPELGADVRRRPPAAPAAAAGSSADSRRSSRPARARCGRRSVDSGRRRTPPNFAYNVGAGADLGLAPRLGLQLMVKDYIGKFDAREATSLNVDTKTTHNWR